MRRSLLTAARASGPVSVGNPAVIGNSSLGGQRLSIDTVTPATATGTIATVNFYAATAGTISILIGTISGTNYTVRSVSAPVSVAAGLNVLTVSMAVVVGDFIGFQSPSSGGGSVRYTFPASGSLGFNNVPTTPPAPGAVLPFTLSGGNISMNGTNP